MQGLTIQQAVENAKARSSESATVPTEQKAEAQDVSNREEDTQEPQDEVLEQEAESADLSEESVEQQIDEDESDDTGSDLFYDLDGEEVSAKQLKEWKSGAMKAADYTRKTQELSEQRKEFDKLQSEFSDKQARLDAKLAEVEAIIADETLDDEAIREMREYEPEKYIEYTERQQKRKKLIEEGKRPEVDFQKEYTDFATSNDGWFEGDKPTEKAQKDIQVMTKYAEKLGLSNDDLSSFRAPHFKLLLDAAKYDSAKSSNASIAKKVRKAPVTTKPRQGVKSSLQQDIQAAQEKFNRTGTIADGIALRKLKAKLNK